MTNNILWHLCPKCHAGYMKKPIYHRDAGNLYYRVPEHLTTTCETCGYSVIIPCCDEQLGGAK